MFDFVTGYKQADIAKNLQGNEHLPLKELRERKLVMGPEQWLQRVICTSHLTTIVVAGSALTSNVSLGVYRWRSGHGSRCAKTPQELARCET